MTRTDKKLSFYSRLGETKQHAIKRIAILAIASFTGITLGEVLRPTEQEYKDQKKTEKENKISAEKKALKESELIDLFDRFIDAGEGIYYYRGLMNEAGHSIGTEFTIAMKQFRQKHKDLKIVSIIPDEGSPYWYTIITETKTSDIPEQK